MSGAPTKTRLTQVSDRDRHVFHFGTETTIGDHTTQDPMFIRFSVIKKILILINQQQLILQGHLD